MKQRRRLILKLKRLQVGKKMKKEMQKEIMNIMMKMNMVKKRDKLPNDIFKFLFFKTNNN